MTGGETFIREVLNQVVAGEHLTREQARQVMDAFMEGKATPAQIGSLLTALRIKGETVDDPWWW